MFFFFIAVHATKGKSSLLVESDFSAEKVISTRLRTTLFTEIGSLKVRIEEEHSGNMAEQGDHQRTLSDFAIPILKKFQSSIVRLIVAAHYLN